ASAAVAIAYLPQLRLFDDDDLPRVDLRFDDDDEREPERLPLLDPRLRLDEPFGSPPFDERLRLDDLPREREREPDPELDLLDDDEPRLRPELDDDELPLRPELDDEELPLRPELDERELDEPERLERAF